MEIYVSAAKAQRESLENLTKHRPSPNLKRTAQQYGRTELIATSLESSPWRFMTKGWAAETNSLRGHKHTRFYHVVQIFHCSHFTSMQTVAKSTVHFFNSQFTLLSTHEHKKPPHTHRHLFFRMLLVIWLKSVSIDLTATQPSHDTHIFTHTTSPAVPIIMMK